MIPVVDLGRQHRALKRDLMVAFERVLDSAAFVLGAEGRAFEAEMAAFCGVRHAVGVGSGTDALRLALIALGIGPGDEVLTPAFSFVASATTILMAGARPVFVDIEPTTFTLDLDALERAITPRTRAIVPVHLYGQPAPMARLAAIARERGLGIVEDAAQAIGATVDGRPVGAWGDAACVSFYPTKNLGALGDGGLVLTDRDDVAEHLRRLRQHGEAGRYRHVELGYCARLDEVQAAALRVKLPYVARWTEARRRLAARYRAGMAGLPLTLPVERPATRHIYHLFTVRHPARDAFAKALADLGVGSAVHYPLPVPGQAVFGGGGERDYPEAWRAAREVLSLPCFPELTDAEADAVITAVRTACERL